jgi:DNA-binding beta-propeller fold protein YncE
LRTRRLAVALAVFALGLPQLLLAEDGPYRKLKEIPIGGEGGWDYLSVDVAARRLYVSHATRVVVVDIDKDAVVGEIAPAPGVHGIAVAPALGRAFVSNGREATASIVDLKTLQIIGTVKTGENPDAILYEPFHKEVYAFNGRGKSATVFDAKTGSTTTSKTRASS